MINNIQGLRAFAVIIVVIFHMTGAALSYGFSDSILSTLGTWGASGVDIFFVISGFIMVYICHKKQRTPKEFIINRLTRIAPLYWILTIAFGLMLALLPSAFRDTTFDINHILSSLIFMSQLLGFGHPTISPGWTLEYEFAFYTLFAFFLFLPMPKNLIITSIALLIIAIFTSINSVIIEFSYGLLAGWLFINGKLKKHAKVLFLIGSIALIASIAYQEKIHRVFSWGTPSLLIVLGCAHLNQIKNNTIILLGNASYSIYLTHILVMPIYLKIITRLDINNTPADIIIIAGTLLCMASGILTHMLLEKPMSNLIQKLKSTPTTAITKI